MLETIYTIPVNEAFDACKGDVQSGCPFCKLYEKLENDELDLILGASMMEPDTRIKTNKLGFCNDHLNKMTTRGKRLPLALMLKTHLDEIEADITKEALVGPKGKKATDRLGTLEGTCYVCERIDNSLNHMIENACLLYATDRDFVAKLKEQPYFCLKHYRTFIDTARRELDKKLFPDFYSDLKAVELAYFDKLRDDVDWFTLKFDYRYENEPWKDSKDAIERTVKFLG